MLASWILTALCLSCARSPGHERLPAWRDRGHLPFFGAIALDVFGHPPDPEAAEQDLAGIASAGANGVVLPVLWTSTDVTSTRIEPFEYGIPLDAYDRAHFEIVRRAHARGLAVEVRPIIRLAQLSPGVWRGTLQPSDWAEWWRSYTRFILHHAELAEAAGAEIFCVGSELGTTESDITRWSALISAVRARFHGCLIYSANWDHYEDVSFWSLLDGIGLSAYYELAAEDGAPVEQLEATWRGLRDRILEWAAPLHKPLYLTEVGYPAQPGAAVHPWDYAMSGPADPEAQARCYRAFTRAWRDADTLKGVTIWIWMHGHAGPADNSYAIAGKPAESVVRDFLAGRRTR